MSMISTTSAFWKVGKGAFSAFSWTFAIGISEATPGLDYDKLNKSTGEKSSDTL